MLTATEATNNIGKRAHRVSGKISRGLALQIHAEFLRDCNGKVVDFVDERVLELPSGCRWTDAYNRPEILRVRICEPRVR